MASPALPVINPFKTIEADQKYKDLYEKGTALRVIKFCLIFLFKHFKFEFI